MAFQRHGADVGIPPLRYWVSNLRRWSGGDNVRGSLTGAVASESVSEALKVPSGWLETIHRVQRHRRELDCDTDVWSRYESRDLVIRWYKVGLPSLNG